MGRILGRLCSGVAPFGVVAALCLCVAPVAYGAEVGGADVDQLLDMSLEDLMQVDVTSASRLKEHRKSTPAAVTVLTQEDIRRSGATSIPELLRLVPSLNVARLDANKWSISSRGFGGRFANKMLVKVDGVSIYSPLFSGTFWEIENVMLEDIERIEVVPGPGSSSWGANAVNGVINIITFPASETRNLLRVGAGTEDRARVGVRVSEKVSEKLALRVSGQYTERDDMRSLGGGDAYDHYENGNLQLRLDWTPSSTDSLTVIGKALYAELHETYRLASALPPYNRETDDTSRVQHGNLLLRWIRTYDEGDDLQVDAYLDHWDNDSGTIGDLRHVADVEVQRRIPIGEAHELVYGGGVRHVWDDIDSRYIQFDPERNHETTLSTFANLSLWAVPDKLRFALGLRLEWNEYTGLETEPSIRVAWTPNEKNTLWASVDGAVRVPARGETDVFLPNLAGPGFLAALQGREDFESEDLIGYEIGYRYVPNPTTALEISLFANDYRNLRSLEVGAPYLGWFQGLPTFILPIEPFNNLDARAVGGQVAIDWRPRPWWRMRPSYAYLNVGLDLNARTIDFISTEAAGDTPRNTLTLWNSFDLSPRVTLDAILQYVDKLPRLRVEDYWTFNMRLGWRPREDLEISIVGQNLLAASRLQYRSSLLDTLPSEIERGVYAEVAWEF